MLPKTTQTNPRTRRWFQPVVEDQDQDQDLGLKQDLMGPTEEFLYWSISLISRVSFGLMELNPLPLGCFSFSGTDMR